MAVQIANANHIFYYGNFISFGVRSLQIERRQQIKSKA
jgi:hypothetical protein